MSVRKIPFLALLALAGGLLAGGAAQAADVRWSVNINVPGPVYAEPVYYAPPPVYYAPPPPVYYRPRPVVVQPPVVVYPPGPPAIVGGSWERHHRHHHWREHRRDWDQRDNWDHRRGHGNHYGYDR